MTNHDMDMKGFNLRNAEEIDEVARCCKLFSSTCDILGGFFDEAFAEVELEKKFPLRPKHKAALSQFFFKIAQDEKQEPATNFEQLMKLTNIRQGPTPTCLIFKRGSITTRCNAVGRPESVRTWRKNGAGLSTRLSLDEFRKHARVLRETLAKIGEHLAFPEALEDLLRDMSQISEVAYPWKPGWVKTGHTFERAEMPEHEADKGVRQWAAQLLSQPWILRQFMFGASQGNLAKEVGQLVRLLQRSPVKLTAALRHQCASPTRVRPYPNGVKIQPKGLMADPTYQYLCQRCKEFRIKVCWDSANEAFASMPDSKRDGMTVDDDDLTGIELEEVSSTAELLLKCDVVKRLRHECRYKSFRDQAKFVRRVRDEICEKFKDELRPGSHLESVLAEVRRFAEQIEQSLYMQGAHHET